MCRADERHCSMSDSWLEKHATFCFLQQPNRREAHCCAGSQAVYWATVRVRLSLRRLNVSKLFCRSHFPCFSVNSGAGSCIDRAMVCIGDAVCNSYLAPVLQACRADQCCPGRCQQAAQRFYGSMPNNVAEMLVMCECEASDQSCMSMKSALHGSTCGEETRTCQETIHDCVEDDNCRYFLPLIQMNHSATAAK